MARGRPSSYTPEIADKICERLACGESLLAISRDEEMPPESTVRRWALDNIEGFAAKYTRARDLGLDHEADEIKELADTCRIGEKRKQETCPKCSGTGDDAEGKDCPHCGGSGGFVEITTGDMVERAKLQIDARKWRLSKMAPKRYGDRLELAGDKENPLVTYEQLQVIIQSRAAIHMKPELPE